MSENWTNQANINRALGKTPEAASAGTVPEVSTIGRRGSFYIDEHDSGRLKSLAIFGGADSSIDFTIENNELAGKLKSLPRSTSLRIFDEAMETEGLDVPIGRNFSLFPGQRMVIHSGQGEQFYQATQAGADELQLTRETVRPQQIIARGSKENFVVNIHDGRAFINGDSIRQDVWLTDENVQTNISKRGRELVINGNEVKGKHHAIAVGNETVHLVDTGQGWELVNDAVFEAKYPKMKEKAERGSWNVPIGDFNAEVPKSLKKLWERGIKPRGWKDAVALFARAVADTGIPGAWTVGFALMGLNLASVGIKELSSLKKSGSFKEYWKQTSFGRLLTGNTKTGLTKDERASALFLGGIITAFSMGASEITTAVLPLMPGKSTFKYFLNRALLGYVGPELVALAGKKLIFGKEAGREEQAKEWLGLTLGVMSATITAFSTAMFVGEGASSLINLIEQRMAAVAAEATPTSSPTAAATETPLPTETATAVPPTPTEVIPPTPTETLPATPFANWHPGVEVNDQLLDQAAAAGHLLDQDDGRTINFFGKELNLFRFDLDKQANDKFPEVIAVKDGDNWVSLMWEMPSGDYAVDLDGDGQIDGFYTQQEFEANFPVLLVEPGRGGGGEAPVLDVGPRDFDLNDDNQQDVLVRVNEAGKEEFFLDRDQDGVIDPAVDEKVDIIWMAKPAGGIGQIVQTITFSDGSSWEAVVNEDNSVSYRGQSMYGWLQLDPTKSNTAALQYRYIQQYGQLFSPNKIGEWGVINPENLESAVEVAAATPEPVVREPVVAEPARGEWPVKAAGEEIWLDAARGGIHGVVQNDLHNNYSELSPEQVTIAAHRLITENRNEVEAFRQPAGDGSAIEQAIQDDSFAPKIQFQVNVVLIEEFLVIHADWFKQNLANLSQGKRYEVAKRAADQWSDWDDDEARKDGLLNIAREVEQEFPNE